MKKFLLIFLGGFAACASFGQGLMTFGNFFPGQFVAPIFAVDPLDPTLSLHGQPASGIVPGSYIVPAGTTLYRGQLLQGSGFTLQLWVGDNPLDLAPVFTTSLRTASANKLPAGLISGNALVSFANVLGGSQGWYDVRVWDNLEGTITDWSTALTVYSEGLLALGSSGPVISQPLGGVDASGGLHPVSPNSMEWASFNIHYNVPEPDVGALVGFALATALLRHARR